MFKEKLKKYRNLGNLTQEELAAKLYISRTLLTKWESGNIYPGKEHIFKLSEILNVDIRKLLTKKEMRKIFFHDYKSKPIEKILLSISSILFVVAITLLIFSFVLENALTNMSNIMKIIPPTRYALSSLLIIASLLLLTECIVRSLFKHKHMYKC